MKSYGPFKNGSALRRTAKPARKHGKQSTTVSCPGKLPPKQRPLSSKQLTNGVRRPSRRFVISGLRAYEEQNDLYEQGRSKPGKIVTNARAGFSNHNFGIAFDVGVFEGTKYLDESPKYKAIGALGIELGLEWGGNWKSIQDEPHFQLRPKWAAAESDKDMLAELRSRKNSGKDFYA